MAPYVGTLNAIPQIVDGKTGKLWHLADSLVTTSLHVGLWVYVLKVIHVLLFEWS